MTFCISRYKNISDKEFDIEVVTPMFLGGANTLAAELRVPSIKGMLRFWWRATCGIESLSEKKKKEKKILGSTDNKAAFYLQIDNLSNVHYQMDLKDRGKKFKVHGHPVSIIDYLAYGTYKYQRGKGNVYQKAHIKPESSFLLKIFFYNDDFKGDVLRALSFFMAFGGLGAKSRNGFGSLFVKDQKISINNNFSLSGFSALSSKARVFTFSQTTNWSNALSEIGLAYREAKLSVEPPHSYTKRKLIVAPITVNKRNEADLERHAKPYFLHVNKLDNGKFQGQILFMPYQYCQTEKRDEYMEVCNKMNEKLNESVRRAK